MSSEKSLLTASTREAAAPGTQETELLPWRVIRPRSRWWPGLGLRQLWAYRELGLTLALRDLQLRYRQTLLGVAWAVLQPLIAMAAFSWVFGQLAGIPSDGLPYPVFVLAGVVPWFYISTAATAAADSLVAHTDLVTRVWFPRPLAPLASVFAGIVDLLIGLLLLVPVMAAYGVAPPPQVLTLPLWLLGAVLVAMAGGLWLSAANVLYRDVRYALPFLLQLWLFVSPVVFPTSLVDEPWRYLYSLNPVVGVIDGLRWALLGATAPGPELAVSVASLLVLLVGGVWYFRRVERIFADRI
jgi:homopolymeric O-antigen transport system permease protein